MEKLTYKQAYDLIIEAYFKDEIKPYRRSFCFCGTLAGNKFWDDTPIHGYSVSDFGKMEMALLTPLGCRIYKPGLTAGGISEGDIEYEDLLFAGMSAALDVLKEIHRSRGENVDELPALTKRVLSTQGK